MNGILTSVSDEQHFETLIHGLITREFGTCDDFLDRQTIQGLRNNLLKRYQLGKMKPAGIGKHFDYSRNLEIRGDRIGWLEPDSRDPFEITFFDKVNRFVHHLNVTCFTGINDYEFHYAYYEEGSFYKRHLDRFRSDRGRMYSLVLYLNENWMEENEGRITLYLPGEELNLLPVEGRVVFFRSDRTEHEVHASFGRPRLSIAGWLKKG